MNKYHAIGDYGPLADQCIFRNFYASSPKNVLVMYKEYIIRHHGENLWNKIGYRNVQIFNGWME